MSKQEYQAAVIGGSVSGLAIADRLSKSDLFDEIIIYERQTYDDKRVDCGEAINDSTLVPLKKTPENGFVNDIDGFQLQVFSGMERPSGEPPIGISNLRCDPGYICERDVVERSWAKKLMDREVEFETGSSVSPTEYEQIVDEYDYIFDASGQPSLTMKSRGETNEYTADMVALNATVEGNFSEYRDRPRIFFEGYVGYSWSFPKSDSMANVGIGWAGDQRPDDYMAALEDAAERNGFPVPSRKDVNIYTIPRGPSLDPSEVYDPETNVFLVGDAAGIANRYQGEGICQSIRSAYLLCDLIEEGNEVAYPGQLYDLMKSEYRLAHLMRGAWVEHESSELLANIAEALEGLTIEDITRSPPRVINRVARNPVTALKLVSDGGMLTRIYEAYTDKWEYGSTTVS